MNFLFFSGGSYVGGMEIVVQSLMAKLRETGHRTLAIVSGWNNGDYPARLTRSGLPFEEVKLGRLYKSRPRWTLDTLRNMPAAALKLRRLASDFRPDFVVYPEPQLLLMGSLILPGMTNALYQHNVATGILTSRSIRYVETRVARIICVSEFVADTLPAAELSPGKIAVVRNGIDLPATPAQRTPSSAVRLGIVGQIIPRKRHLLLLRALAALKAQRPENRFTLKIIGNGDTRYTSEATALIEELNLKDCIEWSGFFTDRDDIYRQLDVVVAPAVDEPFGTTILEAKAYGLPVIAARSGGFPEMIVDGTSGLLFDADDLDSLVAGLARLVADSALRLRLGDAGYQHVAKAFSVERMAVEFAAALDQAPAT